eukprot:TRINITY_DN58925_c0_g1_i1.p1 TRINITY_DN58925_c0_g1~~TRINITY_DN58925_c0_g1_i1.p1  ORF type:complete len:374 (+),score=24.95 TRINITY_DN58925_c0_g1_i1:13-1134(+)
MKEQIEMPPGLHDRLSCLLGLLNGTEMLPDAVMRDVVREVCVQLEIILSTPTSNDTHSKVCTSPTETSQNPQISEIATTDTKMWTSGCRCVQTLTEHSAEVTSLVAIGAGSFASAAQDGCIKLWDVSSHTCVATLESGSCDTVHLTSPEPSILVSASGRSVKVWNVSGHNWVEERRIDDIASTLTSLTSSQVAIGSYAGDVSLWNVVDLTRIARFAAQSGSVIALAGLGPHNFAGAYENNSIRLWSVEKDRCTAVLDGHDECVMALVAIGTDRLASAACDDSLRIWNIVEAECVMTFRMEHSVSSLVVLNAHTLGAGCDDGTMKVIDLEDSAGNLSLDGHDDIVSALVLLGHDAMASASHDTVIKIWTTASPS